MTKKHTDTLLIPELCCSDIKVSVAFYTDILEFNIQYERVDEGFAMLEREGSRIMLDEIGKTATSTSRSWISAPLELPFGRGMNLQINTTDVDKLYEHVQKKTDPAFSYLLKISGIERIILNLGSGNSLSWIPMVICSALFRCLMSDQYSVIS